MAKRKKPLVEPLSPSGGGGPPVQVTDPYAAPPASAAPAPIAPGAGAYVVSEGPDAGGQRIRRYSDGRTEVVPRSPNAPVIAPGAVQPTGQVTGNAPLTPAQKQQLAARQANSATRRVEQSAKKAAEDAARQQRAGEYQQMLATGRANRRAKLGISGAPDDRDPRVDALAHERQRLTGNGQFGQQAQQQAPAPPQRINKPTSDLLAGSVGEMSGEAAPGSVVQSAEGDLLAYDAQYDRWNLVAQDPDSGGYMSADAALQRISQSDPQLRPEAARLRAEQIAIDRAARDGRFTPDEAKTAQRQHAESIAGFLRDHPLPKNEGIQQKVQQSTWTDDTGNIWGYDENKGVPLLLKEADSELEIQIKREEAEAKRMESRQKRNLAGINALSERVKTFNTLLQQAATKGGDGEDGEGQSPTAFNNVAMTMSIMAARDRAVADLMQKMQEIDLQEQSEPGIDVPRGTSSPQMGAESPQNGQETPQEGDMIVNDSTGERMQLVAGQWVTVK